MVARRYYGLSDPQPHFEALRPAREALIRMSSEYRPGGAEYMALVRVVQALDEACGALMNRPAYFHTGMPGEARAEERYGARAAPHASPAPDQR